MKPIRRPTQRLSLAQLVAALSLAFVAIALDHSALSRSWDMAIEHRIVQPLLYGSELSQEEHFTILAVDARLVGELGCPPYDDAVLSKIEKEIARLNITHVLLAMGEHDWLTKTTRRKMGAISYLVPASANWDSYSRQISYSTPWPSSRVEPIPALSVLNVDPNGYVHTMPKSPSEGPQVPILAHWLARTVSEELRSPRPGEPIKFDGPAGTIPTLPLSQIFHGEFRGDDIQSKTVALAITANHCRVQLPVPTDEMGMSPTEIHLNAAKTLLTPHLGNLPAWARALFIFSATLLAVLIIQWIPLRGRLLFAALAIFVWTVTTLGLALLLESMIPLSAVILAFILVYALFSITHTVQLLRELKQTNLRLAQRIEIWAHSSDPEEDKMARRNFDYLIEFVRNFVEVLGAYLFVLPLDAYHFKMYLSLDCDESHIKERRRDMRRMPWLGCISSAHGSFLNKFMQETAHAAYGIPLYDYGVALGMIVLIVPAELQLSDRTRTFLERVGDFMSEILLSIRARERQRLGMLGSLKTLLGRGALQNEVDQIQTIAAGVHNQLERYKMILDRANMGIIVSDIVGNIYYLNEPANRFVALPGVKYNKRLTDLLESLMPETAQNVPGIIEDAIMAEELNPFEWTCDQDGKTYQLTVSTISFAEDETAAESEKRITGLLTTVADTTSTRHLDKLKSQVLALASHKGRSIVDHARETMAPPPVYATQLSVGGGGGGATYDSTWDELYLLFEQFMRLSEKIDIPKDRAAETPYDVARTINDVVGSIRKMAEERQVKLNLTLPQIAAPAFGNWTSFKRGFQIILIDTIASCLKGEVISVEVMEKGDIIHVSITDQTAKLDKQTVQAISQRQWDEIPDSLAEGFKTWEKGAIPFFVGFPGSTGITFNVFLRKL